MISSHESQQASVQEERARERELKVRQATLEQIKGQLEDDIKRLRDTLPSKQAQTVETALDMKYLKDRQAKHVGAHSRFCVVPRAEAQTFFLLVLLVVCVASCYWPIITHSWRSACF